MAEPEQLMLPFPSHRHRLILEFSPEAYESFQEIKRESGGGNDTIRRALRVFDYFACRQAEGCRIEAVKPGYFYDKVRILPDVRTI